MAYEWLAPILFILIMGFIVIISIAATVFWIWMLIDAAKRDFKNENDKLMWILIIVLVGSIGALVYYFMVKRAE